jgi:DNA-binding transcriptional ArsR family regulator
MSKHERMSPRMLDRVARQFRALSEPSRLALMNCLFDGKRTVGELVLACGLSLANASKHLGVLHDAGWVTRERIGLNVVYSLADARTMSLCELMCSRVRERAAAEATLTARPGRRAR